MALVEKRIGIKDRRNNIVKSILITFTQPPYYASIVMGGLLDILLIRPKYGLDGTAYLQLLFFVPSTFILSIGTKADIIWRYRILRLQTNDEIKQQWKVHGAFYRLMAFVYFQFGVLGILMIATK